MDPHLKFGDDLNASILEIYPLGTMLKNVKLPAKKNINALLLTIILGADVYCGVALFLYQLLHGIMGLLIKDIT